MISGVFIAMEGEAFAQGKLKFASYVLTFSARASTFAPGSSKPWRPSQS